MLIIESRWFVVVFGSGDVDGDDSSGDDGIDSGADDDVGGSNGWDDRLGGIRHCVGVGSCGIDSGGGGGCGIGGGSGGSASSSG